MPLYYFILLFIGLPVLELALLLKIHEQIRFWPTFLLVIGTGVLGITLVKRQGLSILLKIQREIAQGQAPTTHMIDGAMLLLAGALLITPGLISDTAGFLLLIVPVRAFIKQWIRTKIEKKLRARHIQINVHEPNDFY